MEEVEIIICEDERMTLERITKIVDKYMKTSNQKYNIITFEDYNQKFMSKIKEKDNSKIYILDIETPTNSGIDVARIIRNSDLESIIIFLTGHEELGPIVLQKDLNFLAFINKFDNSENRLKKTLEKSLKLLRKPRMLKLTDSNIEYIIKCEDILYLTKDSVERKTIIKTTKREYKVGLAMKEILIRLGEDFIQTHKSCIVNKNRIEVIDKKNSMIIFDNGEVIDLLSDTYKKKLVGSM